MCAFCVSNVLNRMQIEKGGQKTVITVMGVLLN